MIRPCPICLSLSSELLYEYHLTSGEPQQVFSCLPCGMVYASIASSVDYEHSIYEAAGAIGSGVSEFDSRRLTEVAGTVAKCCPKHASVLDVGCSQGGLLDALRARGFTNLTGLDPSPTCVALTCKRGHTAFTGFLSDIPNKFDFITLCHVLEHIPDLHDFLRQVLEHLNCFGRVYIEVPSAFHYSEYPLPLLDFNSEHINHFDTATLLDMIGRCGLSAINHGFKDITLTSGAAYPAIWIIAERKLTATRVSKYIYKSGLMLATANRYIEQALAGVRDISIWGAGEYLSHVIGLPAIASRNIVQVVDRNRALHGRIVGGCVVQSPAELDHTRPVVVAAIVAASAIRKEAETMGLKVITLEFQ